MLLVIVDLAYHQSLYLTAMAKLEQEDAGVVGSGCVFEGAVSGTGSLVVRGEFVGGVEIDGALQIEPGARLRSAERVSARRVLVQGEVGASVQADVQVTVRESGIVRGDVISPRFALRAGGKVLGRVHSGEAVDDGATG